MFTFELILFLAFTSNPYVQSQTFKSGHWGSFHKVIMLTYYLKSVQ